MADLRRGQHPHAVLSLGVDTGPASWNNKLEVNRWNWDERFVPGREDGNPDGNPLAQYGLGLQERAAVEQGLEAAQSRAKNWWPNVPAYNKSQSSAVTPPGSRLKAPSGRVPSPTARALVFAEQGVLTRQREKRVEQLSSKLGVDKVQLVSSPLQIDTTAQAGHNTAPVAQEPTGVASQRTTMRGHTWPATSDYFVPVSPQKKPPVRAAYHSAGWAQTLRPSA